MEGDVAGGNVHSTSGDETRTPCRNVPLRQVSKVSPDLCDNVRPAGFARECAWNDGGITVTKAVVFRTQAFSVGCKTFSSIGRGVS